MCYLRMLYRVYFVLGLYIMYKVFLFSMGVEWYDNNKTLVIKDLRHQLLTKNRLNWKCNFQTKFASGVGKLKIFWWYFFTVWTLLITMRRYHIRNFWYNTWTEHSTHRPDSFANIFVHQRIFSGTCKGSDSSLSPIWNYWTGLRNFTFR